MENKIDDLNVRRSEDELAVERKFHNDNTNPYDGQQINNLGFNKLNRQDIANLAKFSTINFGAFLVPIVYKRIKNKDFKSGITKSELFDISMGSIPIVFEVLQKISSGSRFERVMGKGKMLALGAKFVPIIKQAFDTPGGVKNMSFNNIETILKFAPIIANYSSDSLDGITVFNSLSSFLKVIAGPAMGHLLYNLGGKSNSGEIQSMMGRFNTFSNIIDFAGMFFGGSRQSNNSNQNRTGWGHSNNVANANNTIGINEGVNKAIDMISLFNNMVNNGGNNNMLYGGSGFGNRMNRGSLYQRRY